MNKQIQTFFEAEMAKLTFKELSDVSFLVSKEVERRKLSAKNAPNPNQFDLFPEPKNKTS